jgi:hypothetical protein
VNSPAEGRDDHRGNLLRFLELFAATGFAITQPLLSVFGRSPDTFIFRTASRLDIVLFALLIALVPALLVWALELAVALVSRRARDVVHLVAIAGLAVLMGLQLAKKVVSLHGVAMIVAGVGFGVVCVLAYRAFANVRVWLRFASPAPIAFLLVFIVASPVSDLVFPKEAHAAQLGSSANAPSVVVVTFDEWPTSSFVGSDGKVEGQLFPNLARLAQGSTWYRNETTVTNSTWYAVPAIMTGMYPKDGQIPEASAHPQNIFTFLGGTYRLSVFETVTRLCPPSLCAAPKTSSASGVRALLHDAASAYRKMLSPSTKSSDVTAGFEERATSTAVDDARNATSANDHANIDLGLATTNRPERFAQFLDSLKPNEKPTLHYLHILLPHVAYRYLPSGQQYASPSTQFGESGDGTWTTQAWPPALAHERMLLQAAYADQLVGQLLDRLRATGLYDRSVLVVTADHGIAFTPGQNVRGEGDQTVPPSLYPQVLWAPLFVKASGQKTGAISDANVMSIDVLPTIAKLVGFKIPWKVDGVPAGERTGDQKTFMWAKTTAFGVGIASNVTYDGAPGEHQMLADNVDGITEPGDPALRLYRVAPQGVLVGHTVTSLDVGAPGRGDATLAQLDALHKVNLSSGSVPALVWGTLDHAGTVAIAVNGKIGGVSPTFRDGNVANRFAMMVPDSLLRDGSNDVALYEVTGSASSPQLHRLTARQGG